MGYTSFKFETKSLDFITLMLVIIAEQIIYVLCNYNIIIIDVYNNINEKTFNKNVPPNK